MRARCCRELHLFLSLWYYNLVIWDARFSYLFTYKEKRDHRILISKPDEQWPSPARHAAVALFPSPSTYRQTDTAPEHIL
jgi:hypothetical protein